MFDLVLEAALVAQHVQAVAQVDDIDQPVADDGVVVAACRYLDASAENIDVPLGLGSRHLAAASISKRLGAIAIVVSESAVVRVFHKGRLIAEILPELWLLTSRRTELHGDVQEQRGDVTVVTPSAKAKKRR